jgi:hypothetical protein
VIALDVREDDAPEGSVIGASRIDFTRTETGVRINEIDGASVGTKYRFLLLAVGG